MLNVTLKVAPTYSDFCSLKDESKPIKRFSVAEKF